VATKKGGEQMGIHKGTRLTETPKDKSFRFRIDAETERKLNFICEQTNKTKSEVVRDGIEKQYAEIQK
jgi:predicted DNA-binding protein